MSAGERLRLLRVDRGLSVRQIADEASISAATWAKAERDEFIWMQSRKAIADYIGESVSDLWPELVEHAA